MHTISGILGGHPFNDFVSSLDDAKETILRLVREWEKVHISPADYVRITHNGEGIFYYGLRFATAPYNTSQMHLYARASSKGRYSEKVEAELAKITPRAAADASDFRETASELTEQLRSLVTSSLANKGDTCSQSQRICVLEALNALERTINGVQDDDMKGHQ